MEIMLHSKWCRSQFVGVHRTKPARYDLLLVLNVLYNPFRDVTPLITSFALRYVWLMVNTMSLVLAVIACTETKDASERKGR